MYVVTTECDTQARAFVVARETRGLLDLVAHGLVSFDERHCTPGHCLIDPPPWTWSLGVSPISLGDAIWRLGQWAFGRQSGIYEVWRVEVTEAVLQEHFGWGLPAASDD